MAGLFPCSDRPVRLLDAGAGKGALTSAFIHHWRVSGQGERIEADAYELDEHVMDGLEATMASLQQMQNVAATIIRGDFIERGTLMERQGKGPRYTHAILNPPYKKINTASQHRTCLRMIGLETVNLYSGFVGLSLALMEDGGELVAIIPRSFCNGPYYEPFRRFILSRAALRLFEDDRLIVSMHSDPRSRNASRNQPIIIPFHLSKQSRRGTIVPGDSERPRRDTVLIRALKQAHAQLERDVAGQLTLDSAPDMIRARRILRLALLAPDLQRAILEGRQPRKVTLARLIDSDIPLLWSEQRRLFAAIGWSTEHSSLSRCVPCYGATKSLIR